MIRPAQPADAAALAAVLGDWVRETGWRPVLHSRAEDVSFVSHLIETAEVWCVEGAGFLARRGQEVLALYLAPGARGRGLGTALLSRAKVGRDCLGLWTFQANSPAIAFYKANGFSETEQTDGMGNQERLPDVRLVWRRT